MQKRNKLTIDPSRIKISLLFAVVIIVADQASKYLVRTGVGQFEVISVIDGLFQIVYAKNTGVAFGFLSNLNPRMINPILSFLNIAIMIFLCLIVLIEDLSLWTRAAFGLILGGAAGNLIDRLLLGFVVDFLDFYVGKAHWPAFNVADAAITLGVILLIADQLFGGGGRKVTA